LTTRTASHFDVLISIPPDEMVSGSNSLSTLAPVQATQVLQVLEIPPARATQVRPWPLASPA
ncbi:MAG: hypothetical protein QME82_03875, partial [Bacillota bacterium]|nr:hypothetical protein [Bacillota bacterium]